MADWSTYAELATGIGTLALALATFSSVRAANRSTKISERTLLRDILPLLISSRTYDPEDKISFGDDYWVRVKGGHAHAAASDQAIYFVISLRNAGQGLAILDRWRLIPEGQERDELLPDTTFDRRLSRDLYIAAGDTGLWQGALRDNSDNDFQRATDLIKRRQHIFIDIQYSDQGGGQTTVSRFNLTPVGDDDWLTSLVRHWRLDGTRPR